MGVHFFDWCTHKCVDKMSKARRMDGPSSSAAAMTCLDSPLVRLFGSCSSLPPAVVLSFLSFRELGVMRVLQRQVSAGVNPRNLVLHPYREVMTMSIVLDGQPNRIWKQVAEHITLHHAGYRPLGYLKLELQAVCVTPAPSAERKKEEEEEKESSSIAESTPVLEFLGNVRVLKLQANGIVVPDLKALLSCVPKLNELELALGSRHSGALPHSDLIPTLSRVAPSLTRLDLSGWNVTSQDSFSLAGLKELPNLATLGLPRSCAFYCGRLAPELCSSSVTQLSVVPCWWIQWDGGTDVEERIVVEDMCRIIGIMFPGTTALSLLSPMMTPTSLNLRAEDEAAAFLRLLWDKECRTELMPNLARIPYLHLCIDQTWEPQDVKNLVDAWQVAPGAGGGVAIEDLSLYARAPSISRGGERTMGDELRLAMLMMHLCGAMGSRALTNNVKAIRFGLLGMMATRVYYCDYPTCPGCSVGEDDDEVGVNRCGLFERACVSLVPGEEEAKRAPPQPVVVSPFPEGGFHLPELKELQIDAAMWIALRAMHLDQPLIDSLPRFGLSSPFPDCRSSRSS